MTGNRGQLRLNSDSQTKKKNQDLRERESPVAEQVPRFAPQPKGEGRRRGGRKGRKKRDTEKIWQQTFPKIHL